MATVNCALAKKPLLYSWYETLVLPPSRLYLYKLLRKLGEGSSGTVWLAVSAMSEKQGSAASTHTMLKNADEPTSVAAFYAIKEVAIKKPNHLTLFKREVKVLLNLSSETQRCPHVVQLKDWFYCAVTHKAYLVMNYIPSRAHLQKRLFGAYSAASLDYGAIAQCIRQLCEATAYCHSHGIMHCDIKPRNLILDCTTTNNESKAELHHHSSPRCTTSTSTTTISSQWHLTLVDFGHAQFYFPGEQYSVSVGTTAYCAPEILCAVKEYDCSVDVWSIGCILLLLLFPQAGILFHWQTREEQLAMWRRRFGEHQFQLWWNYRRQQHLLPQKSKIAVGENNHSSRNSSSRNSSSSSATTWLVFIAQEYCQCHGLNYEKDFMQSYAQSSNGSLSSVEISRERYNNNNNNNNNTTLDPEHLLWYKTFHARYAAVEHSQQGKQALTLLESLLQLHSCQRANLQTLLASSNNNNNKAACFLSNYYY
jgi:serine/threonine protein kinase